MRSTASPRAVSSSTGTDDCWRSDFSSSNPVPPGSITSRMIELVLAGERGAQSGGMIVGGIDRETFPFEETFQQVDQAMVVIDDKEAVHGLYSAFSWAVCGEELFRDVADASQFFTVPSPSLNGGG